MGHEVLATKYRGSSNAQLDLTSTSYLQNVPVLKATN